ncbi:MAG: hypothetical protein ACRC2J_19510 [Microcoleaceae cyanobacterium]
MNTKLVDSIIQIVLALTKEEQELLTSKLFYLLSEPTSQELIQLAEQGDSFNFLNDEPDLYSVVDGEPV